MSSARSASAKISSQSSVKYPRLNASSTFDVERILENRHLKEPCRRIVLTVLPHQIRTNSLGIGMIHVHAKRFVDQLQSPRIVFLSAGNLRKTKKRGGLVPHRPGRFPVLVDGLLRFSPHFENKSKHVMSFALFHPRTFFSRRASAVFKCFSASAHLASRARRRPTAVFARASPESRRSASE